MCQMKKKVSASRSWWNILIKLCRAPEYEVTVKYMEVSELLLDSICVQQYRCCSESTTKYTQYIMTGWYWVAAVFYL